MNDIIIALVPLTLVDHMWPKCIKHFERVVKICPNDFTIASIAKSVYSGNYSLVTMSEGDKVIACAIVEINTLDSGYKILAIPLVAGTKMSRWAARFLNICHIVAREQGCDSLQGYAARKGWLKYLEKSGWKQEFTTVRCKVKEIIADNVVPLREEK